MGDLIQRARQNDPHSSYSMVAAYIKGKRRILGFNCCRVSAQTCHSSYAHFMGRHAELHVWMQLRNTDVRLRGGTLYVAGTHVSATQTPIASTAPCEYCRALIADEFDLNFIVYYKEGELVKETFRDFVAQGAISYRNKY